MDLFTRENAYELLRQNAGPCLSLYMPTRPGGGEQDPIRWRRCLSDAEETLLAQGWSAIQAAEFLRPAGDLGEKGALRGPGHALAYFLAPGLQRLYRLPFTVELRAAVGPHCLITPLLPLLHENRFFVLALSQKGVRLLHATRDTVSPVELTGVPRSLDEAMATHDVDEPLTFHTRPTSGRGFAAIFHGHGVGIDDHKDDLLRYFQQVDHGLRKHLNGEREPLVLAAVEYLHPIFQRACRYPGLLREGVVGCPDALSDQELSQRAWRLLEPTFQRDQHKDLALYRQLNGTGRTGSGVCVLVPAAVQGTLETLFVASDRRVEGSFEPASGKVECHECREPQDEDLLNLAAVHTLRHGGRVHALPAAQMPDGSNLAGIYWLPLAKHRKGP